MAHSTKRFIRLVVAAIFLMVVLSGCGEVEGFSYSAEKVSCTVMLFEGRPIVRKDPTPLGPGDTAP